MRIRSSLALLVRVLVAVVLVTECGSSRRRGSQPPCPSAKCRCRRNKQGVGVKCSQLVGALPLFPPSDVTYTSLALVAQNLTTIRNDSFARIQVRALDLSGNPFDRDLPAHAFRGQERSLLELVLSDCRLSRVPTRSTSALSQLRVLHLNGNNITSMDKAQFATNTQLTELHLYRNKISTIHSRAFQGLSQLEHLKLADNAIAVLPKKLFRGLTKLKSLDISRNPLTAIPAGLFKGLANLQFLEVQSVGLVSLEKHTFKGLKSLENLLVDNNSLVRVQDGTFRVIKKLRFLSLDITHVQNLSRNTFKGLTRLTLLNLGEINQRNLPPGLFRSMRKLKILVVTDNEQKFDGFALKTFSKKMRFAGLRLVISPLRVCRCDHDWIRALTSKGVYVEGSCGQQTPLKCFQPTRLRSARRMSSRRHKARIASRKRNK